MKKDIAKAAKSIFKPFQKDLDTFNEYFKNSMMSNLWIVDEVAKYLVRHKGKQLRPMLVITAARTIQEIMPASSVHVTLIQGDRFRDLVNVGELAPDQVTFPEDARRCARRLRPGWRGAI